MTTTAQKLKAISMLPIGDVKYEERIDIDLWKIQKQQLGIDSLTEKQVERINAIFARHFED